MNHPEAPFPVVAEVEGLGDVRLGEELLDLAAPLRKEAARIGTMQQRGGTFRRGRGPDHGERPGGPFFPYAATSPATTRG